MSPSLRSWLAFAAIGAGLIHVALVIGAPLPYGIVLAVLGLAEFAWGVITFARDSVAAPRVTMAVALVPIGVWVLLLVISTAAEAPELARPLGFVPLGIASLFELFIAGAVAVSLRREANVDVSRVASGTRVSVVSTRVGRYLVSLLAAAIVVTALTAVALSATPAGGAGGPLNVVVPGHGH